VYREIRLITQINDAKNIDINLLISEGNLIMRITRVKAEITKHNAAIGFIGDQGGFMLSK
jgi:hypothetical protein